MARRSFENEFKRIQRIKLFAAIDALRAAAITAKSKREVERIAAAASSLVKATNEIAHEDLDRLMGRVENELS